MNCPDDNVRRYPPPPPEAGANAPVPKATARSGTEGSAAPTQVDAKKAKGSPEKVARNNPPPAMMGPDSGPGS
jgi:hypothetical protein